MIYFKYVIDTYYVVYIYNITIFIYILIDILKNDVKMNTSNAEIEECKSNAKVCSKDHLTFKLSVKVILKNWKINKKRTWKMWEGSYVINSLLEIGACTLQKDDKIFLSDVLNTFHTKNVEKAYKCPEKIEAYVCPKKIVYNQSKDNIVTDEAIKPFIRKRYFKPVDKIWMLSTSIKFNLPLKPNNITCVAENTTKLLTKPKCTIDVIGDGNCWYRCISLWITNSENYHESIRNHVYEVIIV